MFVKMHILRKDTYSEHLNEHRFPKNRSMETWLTSLGILTNKNEMGIYEYTSLDS